MPAVEDLRPKVADAVRSAVSSIKTPAQLEEFMTNAERQALSSGRVTAIIVEPVLAAIRSVYSDAPRVAEARTTEFSDRMAALSRRLQPDMDQPARSAGDSPQFDRGPVTTGIR